jgi:hypothetical protein
MRNIKSFENFSSENMSNKTREKMTDYLMSCGYTEEECNSMDLEEMSQVCDGCGMNDVNEARKYTRRKKTAQSQKAQSQKAQSQKAQSQKAQSQKAQSQKAQSQKTTQSKDDVKTFSQVQAQKSKSAQKVGQKMTQKEKELAAKYPPKNKITKGDFIAAAIENKKKSSKKTTK